MTIPSPKPAQVIRYSYLWADEHAAGRDEGIKDRPVVIVMTIQDADKHVRVAVVPITHAPATKPNDAIAIPANIKRHLGLDDQVSWIVLTEINLFVWPGPDLRPLQVGTSQAVVYGYLPSGFFRTVRDQLAANIRAGSLRRVSRTE
jgi:hypothetical protein